MKIYPPSSVSRTIDPSQKSYTTVIGRHDQKLSDADVNLIQDLQDFKRGQQVQNTIFSGALSYEPFVFNSTSSNQFSFPAFQVMFNGEVVTIGGNNANNLSTNVVILPPPTSSTPPSPTIASSTLYVVYLELWYAELNPINGKGYATGGKVYPNGCITVGDASLLVADDIVDSFNNLTTTIRSQVQWTIRCSPLELAYNFTALNYGLDPGANINQQVFSQASLAAQSFDSSLIVHNMGPINGDYGLWVGGGGVVNGNSILPTLDGYSYAMPIAVVFRRTLDEFDQSLTPFGCGTGAKDSGLANPPAGSPYDPSFAPVSGRLDGKFADTIYDSDVIDTRMTVSLQGFECEKTLKNNFISLISGDTQLKIGRGDPLGNDPTAVGSRVGYTISVSNTTSASNVDNVGSFNGYINGFGLDSRPYYTNKTVPISAKINGSKTGPWLKDDTFVLTLPDNYLFSYAIVQGLTYQNKVVLLTGQITIGGIGTSSLNCVFKQDPLLLYNPGINPLQVFVGVESLTAPMSTTRVPYSINYGNLIDAAINASMPVFAVSDFAPKKQLGNFTSYNPNYSNKEFGTILAFTANITSSLSYTILNSNLPAIFNQINSNGTYQGGYVTGVTINGVSQSITSQSVTNSGVTVNFASHISGLAIFSILLLNVAQMGYTAPIKGITSIKETVLFGSGSVSVTTTGLDSRISLASFSSSGSSTTYIFQMSDCLLSGIRGGLLFTENLDGSFSPSPITSASYSSGFLTVVAPTPTSSNFFMIGNIAPAFSSDSSLTTSFDYIPYQGDGKLDNDYALFFSEDFALITTNGTGSAPIIGLQDVFPYNRELPLSVSLPALPAWDDSDLKNQEMLTNFDSNFSTKQFNNTDHTFSTLLKTNDFIEPVSGWKTKKIRLSSLGSQGFSSAYPQVGFAIVPPESRKAVVNNPVLATTAPINIYVNNLTGDDSLDGLSRSTPKQTIQGALSVLPPTLNHTCCVILINSGSPTTYELTNTDFTIAKLGDGVSNPVNHYTIFNLSFTIQEEGLLYIGRDTGVTQHIKISATNYYATAPFTDGPTSAFTAVNSSVIFGGIQFTGFHDQAVYASNSKLSFVDCEWDSNVTSVGLYNGCTASVTNGSLTLDNSCAGFLLSSSDLLSSGLALHGPVQGAVSGFYICERGSNLTLANHSINNESGINPYTIIDIPIPVYATEIVSASLNGTVVCGNDFVTKGIGSLATNSVLTYATTAITDTFIGGVSNLDGTSSIVQSL